MLKRCPSCQASVLDDDAETCPFCGSPMDPAKAKGFKPAASAAPAAKAAAPSAPKAAPAAPVKAAPKPAAAKAAPSPRDDDPFAVDPKAGSTAIALSPKRTQQRPHKIVCPMCDTPGYASEAASGKEVRCANPKCLVPVFTAPDFAAPKPVEPEPAPSGISPTLLTFGIVGVILVGGLAVWHFVLDKPRPAAEPDSVAGGIVTPPPPVTPQNGADKPTEPLKEQVPVPPAPAEVLASVLKRWPAVANDVSEPLRQAVRRRYAAESFAIAGKADAAREQLAKLESIRTADPFTRIPPLAELTWLQAAGDETAARATLAQATALTAQMPQGFDPARAVIDWASAAVRLGQDQQARDLARAPRDDSAGEQLLTDLRASALFSAGDLDAESALRTVQPWSEPKVTAVTLDLLRRGAADQARAWAAAPENVATKAEGLAACAEAAAIGPAEGRGAIDALTANADPAVKSFVLARAAVRLAARGDQKAGDFLARAVEAAGALPAPQPFTAPDLATLAQAELPDQTAVRLAGAALAEAAHAAALLKKNDQAMGLLVQSLDRLRAAAPSPGETADRARELDELKISGVQNRLKSALNLSNDEQARGAANEYRRKLQEVQTLTAERFNLQTELLARAVQWGLGQQVLAEATRRGKADDAAASEPYLAGTAGGRLLAAFQMAGDNAAVQQLRSGGVADRDVPPVAGQEPSALDKLQTGKVDAAAREVDAPAWNRVGRSDKLALAIRLACRVRKERGPSDAYAFAAALRDDAAREDVLRYLSRAAAEAGQGAGVQALLTKLRVGATAEAAALRGLTEGLVAAGALSAAAPTPAAAPATP